MRPYQIFAGMSGERAERFFRQLSESAAPAFQQAVAAAAVAMKARPAYLGKQPFDRRASAVRRMLSRVASDGAAEELLAVYFLDCRKDLLQEWLDLLGLEHEDGMLKDDSPQAPPTESLQGAVERFRSADQDEDRELLMRAFAAQTAIEWKDLDALLEGPGDG